VIAVESKMFGTFEVSEEEVIRLPAGLVGFEEYQRFVLVETDDLKPLVWLVSMEEAELAFPMADPSYFTKHFDVPLAEEDREALCLDEATDKVAIYVVVTLPDGVRPLTANLRGPIVLNVSARIGRQLVLVSDTYSHRQRALADSAGVATRE
jgi:flagellar assembly factor FliW